MRRALACICLAALAHGQDPTHAGGERAFVELIARDAVYVQERFRLSLRVGYDREFFRTEAVQLFRQPLGVPLQILAPWLAHPVGAIALPETAAVLGDGKLSVALDEGLALAAPAGERTVDGRVFDVLEIERSFLATTAGELAIPAPGLRYAFATRFDDDFLNGRVAADRRDALVMGKPLTIAVRPLPEEGRPLEFGGAVGRFSVAAEVSTREIEAGQSFALVLRIEGAGNLPDFEAPRLAGLEGFHLRGTIDDKGASRRTITYDLAPASTAVKEVPALPFVYFDPEPPAGYRTVRTEPIAIRVRAPAAADGGRSAPAGDGRSDAGSSGPGAALYVSVGVFLALAVAGYLHVRRRSRAVPAADPGHARAHAASAAFRARAAEPGANLADAFAGYLAACAGIPPAALKVHGLPALLEGAGVEPALARRAAAVLEAQLAARYGGGPPAGGAEVLRELVDALDDSFTAADAGRAPASG